MTRESTPPGDDARILCPLLGHLISFSYCRLEDRGVPCAGILDCWYLYFLVEDYLRRELNNEEWEKFLRAYPKPKLALLLEARLSRIPFLYSTSPISNTVRIETYSPSNKGNHGKPAFG
jgi:hypothetical protein